MTAQWIVGIDGSEAAVDALRWATRHAGARDAQIDAVGVFHVPPLLSAFSAKRGFGVDEVGIGATAAHEIDVAIERMVNEAAPGQVPTRPVVVEGVAAHELVDAARGADLLVVGRAGSGGLRDHFFGSVSRYCATHSETPVVVVPVGWSASPATRIVVGFDGSEHATQAVRWAIEFAGEEADVTVVAAIDVAPWLDPGLTRTRFPDEVLAEEQRIAQALDILDPERTMTRVIELHSARQALADAAGSADLFVVGARGSGTAMRGVLGSVSTWLIHDASVPVAIVSR